jgi:hypothetical protein
MCTCDGLQEGEKYSNGVYCDYYVDRDLVKFVIFRHKTH